MSAELVFVADVGQNQRYQRRSRYRCGCGALFEALEYNVKSGHTKSCGCLRSAMLSASRSTHREARPQSTEYRIWAGMKTRCLNPRSRNYPRYGGRGITICKDWVDSYETFLKDMGRRPSPKYSLERGINDGPYAPWNVEWATATEQARNKRSTRFIRFQGKRQCLQDWADELGINQSSLIERLQKWPLERALTKTKGR